LRTKDPEAEEVLEQPFGSQLVAGDTWDWLVTLCDYSASAFTLKFFFRGPQTLDIVATPEGDSFRLHKDPADTSALNPGLYRWSAAVFDTNNNNAKTTIADGTVEILPDISAFKSGTDGRSYAKRMLEAIEALLENRVDPSRLSDTYQHDGVMVKYMSPEQLRKERGYWKNQVNKELVASGELSPDFNQVKVGFCS
jgi:hypothetical protein